MIDKTKKIDLQSEPNHELMSNLEKLERFAFNYLKQNNENYSSEEYNPNLEQDDSSLSQPEVESLMPAVKKLL